VFLGWFSERDYRGGFEDLTWEGEMGDVMALQGCPAGLFASKPAPTITTSVADFMDIGMMLMGTALGRAANLTQAIDRPT